MNLNECNLIMCNFFQVHSNLQHTVRNTYMQLLNGNFFFSGLPILIHIFTYYWNQIRHSSMVGGWLYIADTSLFSKVISGKYEMLLVVELWFINIEIRAHLHKTRLDCKL